LFGAALGAVLVNLAKTYFTGAWPEIWLFFLGGLFVFATLFLPRGIVGIFTRDGGPKRGLERLRQWIGRLSPGGSS